MRCLRACEAQANHLSRRLGDTGGRPDAILRNEKLRYELEHHIQLYDYADANGQVTPEANPNGSLNNIAGIVNEQRNVLGMMPHPDRSSEKILGSADGKLIFESLVNALVETGR